MLGHPPSSRAADLAGRLAAAAASLIAVIEPIDVDSWTAVPTPGVWSLGKDVAHVAEATVFHQWIVRKTIGQKVASRRPAIERKEMTTELSTTEAIELLRRRTEAAISLVEGLSDEQLGLPTRPPRARGQLLAETIERVLIGHYDTHRQEIEEKLSRL